MGVYIVAIIAAIIVFVLYMALDRMLNKKQLSSDLTAKIGDHDLSANDEMRAEKESGGAAFCKTMMQSCGVNVDQNLEDSKKQLLSAGISSKNSQISVLFFKKIMSWVFLVIAAILIVMALNNKENMTMLLGAAAVIAIIGIKGVDIYLSNNSQKRMECLEKSFPDTLDLILVCVEAGLTLDAALSRVCSELGTAHPEMTAELDKARMELALLNDREIALNNLKARCDFAAMRSFIVALLQTEKFGTNLSDTLKILARDNRIKRTMLAEEKAGKMPTKLSMVLVPFLLIALGVVLLAPVFIRLSSQSNVFGN